MNQTNEHMGIVNQMSSQINRSNVRLSKLESNAEKDDLIITQSQSSQHEHKELINKQLAQIDIDKNLVFEEIKILLRDISKISNNFKNIVKKQQLELFEKKVDNWDLEGFITKKEFDKMLKERFSNF